MARLLKGKTEKSAQLSKNDGAEMPFLDHLEELRLTIIKCVLALLLFTILMGIFAFKMNELLMWPFDVAVADLGHDVDRPRTASPFAPFMVYFQIIIFGGIFLALPFILYFMAQFIMPALNKRERSVMLPGVTAAAVLFIFGAGIAFFLLLPIMLGVSFRLSEALEISVLFDASKYYSTVTLFVIGAGISFELPLLVVILIYVGILKPAFLRKYRRHIFVLIIIFSALVTPPDPVTLILMAGPLYLLYEIAVLVGERLLKRKLEREKEEEGDDDEAFDPENDPRYQEREFKRKDAASASNDYEHSYYLNYEEERKHYPETDGYPSYSAADDGGNASGSENSGSADAPKKSPDEGIAEGGNSETAHDGETSGAGSEGGGSPQDGK